MQRLLPASGRGTGRDYHRQYIVRASLVDGNYRRYDPPEGGQRTHAAGRPAGVRRGMAPKLPGP